MIVLALIIIFALDFSRGISYLLVYQEKRTTEKVASSSYSPIASEEEKRWGGEINDACVLSCILSHR